MHKLDQCENNVGKSSAGASWLDETDGVEIMGEKPTVAPTFKPTKAPPVQKPTQGPVQQKPTQGPVQQKPTQAPVQQKPPVNLKPTQAPSKKLKPTIAPPRKLKPTQAPVEQVKPTQAPVEQKPTQGPIQQKPTESPMQQKPTQAPVEQKPTQAPVEQKPTQAPVQQKPTQAPVQQKPTESPVQQKPTQSPVQQKPTLAPWIDYPVQELPIEYLPPVQQQKPTESPVQQKPTQAPVQQKPTQSPVQQKPTQLPWRQTKPTQAPVEQVKPTQSPWQDHPGQELPVEYLPPAKERPTQSPVQQKPTQSPVQLKPTQAPNQIIPTQAPWQQQQEWSDDLWAGEDKYLGEMDWDKEPYAELPEEFEDEQLRRPIQKPGSWRGEHWQKPVPVDLAILRDDLSWQAKAIDYYFKAAEEMDNSYCEFFQTKGKEEVRCFKQVLILLNSLNDSGYGQIPQQSLEELLDWETGSKYWEDYMDDGLPGSKGSQRQQSDARQRPRGGFFAPPGRYPRSRMINKPKVRACLTGAVQMVAEAITIYEEQIKHLGHPVVRNLLIRILMHEKKVLAELTEKLLEVLPKES